MAKRGFYPPKNFEESITDFVTLMTDSSQTWSGKIPGNSETELTAIKQRLATFVPLRQKFEQARLVYENAKDEYVNAGTALWTEFFAALSYARTYAKKDAVLSKGLNKYKRSFAKRTPPKTKAT